MREVLLTAKGRRDLARAFPRWRDAQKTVRRRLGAGRMNDLAAGLKLVVRSLRGA